MAKIIIIGAGASGLACAIKLKQQKPDLDVTILEHLAEPCKKIYATGNGRCNLTNTSASGFAITKAFFSSIGLVMREGGEGRIYPYSNQAASVAHALLAACRQYNISIITNCRINTVTYTEAHFCIHTDSDTFLCDALVLATGGKSQPALGSDGSGYALAKQCGHTVTPLAPALVQLTSPVKYCRMLKGLRMKCALKVEINGAESAAEQGELLFTDYGISGIVSMDISKNINDERLKDGKERCVAVIDFTPDISEAALISHAETFGTLEGILPEKLCAILMKQTDGDLITAAKYAKNWRIIISGTKGYDFAQITRGGVCCEELTDAYASKKAENLYIIGELTDKQFPCGGFNLDHAFASGILAAEDLASKDF